MSTCIVGGEVLPACRDAMAENEAKNSTDEATNIHGCSDHVPNNVGTETEKGKSVDGMSDEPDVTTGANAKGARPRTKH